jgi:DNA-binding response OmpR family regulator
MVAEQLPDLLVINVVLSGQLDGMQVARLIQEFHPLPLIFIHFRQPSREQKRELRDMGRYVWLNKPFQVEKLQSAIESLLQTSYQKHGNT